MELRAEEFRNERLRTGRSTMPTIAFRRASSYVRRPIVPTMLVPEISPARLHAMELRAEEFRNERLRTGRSTMPTIPFCHATSYTPRPASPTISEPEISPARLHAMELRAEEFRKEKLRTRRPTVPSISKPEISPARLHATELRVEESKPCTRPIAFRKARITRRPTIPSTSEPEINPGRLYAMELRAKEFRKEKLLGSHLSKWVHQYDDHMDQERRVERMRDHLLLERCFRKLVVVFHDRYELKGDEAVELLEQQHFIAKAVERQHVKLVRHIIDNDETIEELPKFERRHNPTLDLPTVTDMGNLGDVDTTSITLPDQPQLDTPKQPVEEESREIELTSVTQIIARAGLVGFENLSRFLGDFVNKARALIASYTGPAEVIEQQPQPRQPPVEPVEDPSIAFGLTKERDPLYRSATPDMDASVLDGFLTSKNKQNGRVHLGSDEHHEYQPPAKPGRPSSLKDYSATIRTLDLPTITTTTTATRYRRFGPSTRTLRNQG
ncbi:hypothetical protein BLS_006577 [Venturia inaequalis]|uniref:Uncharacterized protein n=1 Tax=Venturia inaequalis TaxID=5025 RepID=A0A8H3YN77_VENIN|nr:hypothetical protein BLS_006577 [Venturia inaequalis]